jgi:integrase
MASIYKRGTIWYIAWHDEFGRRRYRSTGQKTKRLALRWLHTHEENDQTRVLSDDELIDLWIKELESIRRSEVHTKQRRRDLDYLGTSVSKANQLLGSMDRSDQTVRSYYKAAKQWGRWCYVNGHRSVDVMLGLKLPTPRTGRVYIRGVFTQEEAELLRDNNLLYEISLATGLRLGELRKLEPENKQRIKGQSCLWLKPRGTKNRFEDIIPISEEIWGRLQLPMWVPSRTRAAKYLRRDLERLSIPVMDQDDHPRDWHSMRVTFCDLLIKQGVPIPTVARLMRHSDGGGLLLRRYAVGVI